METKSNRVLCVGLVCLDIINECETFPDEDSDQRCLSLRWQRGGNAANNCTVLSQIGVKCEFLGTMSLDPELSFISKDFIDHGICTKHCPVEKSMPGKSFLDSFPVSTIILNSVNGSRTILHSKGDLPELSFEHFKNLDLSQYSWIHFEGRNVEAVTSMMLHIKSWRNKKEFQENETSYFSLPIISVELEKPKLGLLALAVNADVIFMSKDFAKHHGWNGIESVIQGMTSYVCEGAVVVCAWGESGSSASHMFSEKADNANDSMQQDCCDEKKRRSKLYHSPAYSPPVVKDTLGAGDTFVAGFIHSFSRDFSIEKALQFACKLAGGKVGMKGFTDIKKVYVDILSEYTNKTSL